MPDNANLIVKIDGLVWQSLVTRTNHNTILTIDIYVRCFPDSWPRRTDFHTTPGQQRCQSNSIWGLASI